MSKTMARKNSLRWRGEETSQGSSLWAKHMSTFTITAAVRQDKSKVYRGDFALKQEWVFSINCFWEVQDFRLFMWDHPQQQSFPSCNEQAMRYSPVENHQTILDPCTFSTTVCLLGSTSTWTPSDPRVCYKFKNKFPVAFCGVCPAATPKSAQMGHTPPSNVITLLLILREYLCYVWQKWKLHKSAHHPSQKPNNFQRTSHRRLLKSSYRYSGEKNKQLNIPNFNYIGARKKNPNFRFVQFSCLLELLSFKTNY